MVKIGFIGCGNMGEAMVSGLLHAKWARPEEVIVSTKTIARGEVLKRDYGITVAKNNREVAKTADLLILAIKPNLYKEVIEEILPFLDHSKILVSITPSFTLETLKSLSGGQPTVARAMPNTPAKVGYGMTGLTFEKNTSSEIREKIIALFSCFGKVLEVEEDMMKVVGSLSGSAPAFIELFMKAMVESGISYGMKPEDARKLVLETFLGTAQLALATNKSFDAMIAEVCSKGGSTIQGITFFKENHIEKIVQEAVNKTTARFVEMAEQSK